jgi:hypothetical protein
MAPFDKGGGPQDRGIFASIFMRSVAATNCIFIRGAKGAMMGHYGTLRGKILCDECFSGQKASMTHGKKS